MYKFSEIFGKNIALVDLLTEQNKLFGDITYKAIKKYERTGKKVLFIVNRKGYTSSTICEDCGYIKKCNHCDIPIAKYKVDQSFLYMCPICRKIYENNILCSNCGGTNIKEYGIGTYKMQEILKETFNIDAFIIENTDVNSLNKISKINKELENKQFVISTSILSCHIKGFIPDLVIFLNADTGLFLPNFNVGEKHFLFLYEFIKNHKTSNYIIQTFNIEHYVYKFISKLDLDGFWEKELSFRKEFNYPPYADLAVIMYKSEIEEKLYNKISKLESELKYLIEKEGKNIEIFPTPQLVYKKFGKYHYNIVLKGSNLKSFIDKAVVLLKLKQNGFQIDWLPTSII